MLNLLFSTFALARSGGSQLINAIAC
jgi:hypothetical protein